MTSGVLATAQKSKKSRFAKGANDQEMGRSSLTSTSVRHRIAHFIPQGRQMPCETRVVTIYLISSACPAGRNELNAEHGEERVSQLDSSLIIRPSGTARLLALLRSSNHDAHYWSAASHLRVESAKR